MQREWKDRVLEALEIALKVAHRRRRGTRKTEMCNSFEKGYGSSPGGNISLCESEREALGTLLLARVLLQMEPFVRGHPHYREACRVLEELPLWSLEQEVANQVIDTLSSILGLPFRYAPKPFRFAPIVEAGAARSYVGIDGHTPPLAERVTEDRETRFDVVYGGHPCPPGASDRTGLGSDVGRVVDAKIEHAKKLLGLERIVK